MRFAFAVLTTASLVAVGCSGGDVRDAVPAPVTAAVSPVVGVEDSIGSQIAPADVGTDGVPAAAAAVAASERWAVAGIEMLVVAGRGWHGEISLVVDSGDSEPVAATPSITLELAGAAADGCDVDGGSWAAVLDPVEHPRVAGREWRLRQETAEIIDDDSGSSQLRALYSVISGMDRALLIVTGDAVCADPDQLTTAAEPDTVPEPEPASDADPDDHAVAEDALDDDGHEHDSDGHEHDPDLETQIPEESEGHTARIVDVGDGAMPAEPGGVPRKPAWFVNGPDWIITPTVQAFSDWCHQPLYEPLPYDHSHVPSHRDALIHSCVDALHSMSVPSDPRVAVPGDCLLAVTQEAFLRVRRRVGWPIVWADRTSPLPAHIGPERNSVDKPYPHWADCPSKLWPGPYLPARDHPDAERACHWAGSVVAELDPEETWAAEQGAWGTLIGWGTTADGDSSCVTNLWDPRLGRCGFASERHSDILFRAGELPKFMEWANCE